MRSPGSSGISSEEYVASGNRPSIKPLASTSRLADFRVCALPCEARSNGGGAAPPQRKTKFFQFTQTYAAGTQRFSQFTHNARVPPARAHARYFAPAGLVP